MIVAEVIGRNFYTRRNGETTELPIGATVVVKNIPETMSGKLRKVRDAKDSEFIVNDTPESAKLRDEGKTAQADKALAEAKEKLSKKPDAEAAKKRQAEAAKAAKDDGGGKTGLPKPSAKE